MPRPVRATEDQGSTKWIEAELPYRSVWLPIRIVGEQTAIGEADVVDEEQPKSKTDICRRASYLQARQRVYVRAGCHDMTSRSGPAHNSLKMLPRPVLRWRSRGAFCWRAAWRCWPLHSPTRPRRRMLHSKKETQQQQGKEICGRVGHRSRRLRLKCQRLKRGGQQYRIATISLLRTEQLSRRSLK
jgi:hypothetical protein